jgi:transposase
MNGVIFQVYLRQCLVPTLSPGDVVILDNLPPHKLAAAREIIAAAGATRLYLPPYSPDLNPIEPVFAKLKALLRKAAKRSIDGLGKQSGELLDAFTAARSDAKQPGIPGSSALLVQEDACSIQHDAAVVIMLRQEHGAGGGRIWHGHTWSASAASAG